MRLTEVYKQIQEDFSKKEKQFRREFKTWNEFAQGTAKDEWGANFHAYRWGAWLDGKDGNEAEDYINPQFFKEIYQEALVDLDQIIQQGTDPYDALWKVQFGKIILPHVKKSPRAKSWSEIEKSFRSLFEAYEGHERNSYRTQITTAGHPGQIHVHNISVIFKKSFDAQQFDFVGWEKLTNPGGRMSEGAKFQVFDRDSGARLSVFLRSWDSVTKEGVSTESYITIFHWDANEANQIAQKIIGLTVGRSPHQSI